MLRVALDNILFIGRVCSRPCLGAPQLPSLGTSLPPVVVSHLAYLPSGHLQYPQFVRNASGSPSLGKAQPVSLAAAANVASKTGAAGVAPPVPAVATSPSAAKTQAPAALQGPDSTTAPPDEPKAVKPPLDAIQVILQAVENCKPMMKVHSNKAGAKMVHVPKPVSSQESRSLAIRWIVQAAQKRKTIHRNTPFAECLALELLQAFQRKGGARQKRDDLHKLALENRANVTRM